MQQPLSSVRKFIRSHELGPSLTNVLRLFLAITQIPSDMGEKVKNACQIMCKAVLCSNYGITGICRSTTKPHRHNV
jgi:hypothetical protein